MVEWATPRKYKIMNTMLRKKAGRRWTWKSPNGETKTEIDYILTHRPDIVTDVTVINHVNIESDNRLVMSNIKLDVEVERTTLMTKRPPRADATRIGSKKIEFQLELRNRLETLQELDNIDTLSKTISDMIQQSASRVAKAINKSHKSRISSPTRALMTKRREMAGNADNKQRIEYTEICKTIKKINTRGHLEIQPRDHTRTDHGIKEPEESPKNADARRQDRLITLLNKQGRNIHDQGKIIERIEEFYPELCGSEQNTIINTDPKEVPEITSWELEAPLLKI